MYIAENDRLDLVAHPVIEALIEVKWIDFARFFAFFFNKLSYNQHSNNNFFN